MKSISVRLGVCGTCGQKVKAYVNAHDWLTTQGEDLTTIEVEGHCGEPGHASRVATLSKDEFDAAKDGATI